MEGVVAVPSVSNERRGNTDKLVSPTMCGPVVDGDVQRYCTELDEISTLDNTNDNTPATNSNNENNNAEIVASRVLSAMAAAAAVAAATSIISPAKSTVAPPSPTNTTGTTIPTKQTKKKLRKASEQLLNNKTEIKNKAAAIEVEIKVANTAVNTTGVLPKSKAERQPAQRPKSYAQKACSHCKNSHVACDAGRPCKRCIRLNRAESCADADRKKRGRPSNAEKDNKSASSLFLTFAVNLDTAATTTATTASANNTPSPSSSHQSPLRNAAESPTDTGTATAALLFEDSPENNSDTVPAALQIKQPPNSVKALIASRVEGRQAAAAAAVAAAISVSTDASCDSSSLFESRLVEYDPSSEPLVISEPITHDTSVSACPPTSLAATNMTAKAAHEFTPTSLISATVPPAKERRKRKAAESGDGGGGG
ncbi:hypothetical protein HK100_005356, partial [Physocladia obscura]